MVKLQILLRREYRTTQGIEAVRKILASMGLTPTIAGLATISADATPERFAELFGTPASEPEAEAPHPADSGQSGEHSSGSLAVPAPLQQSVESITVAPRHIYLRD